MYIKHKKCGICVYINIKWVFQRFLFKVSIHEMESSHYIYTLTLYMEFISKIQREIIFLFLFIKLDSVTFSRIVYNSVWYMYVFVFIRKLSKIHLKMKTNIKS